MTEAKDIASKLKDVKVLPAKKATAIEGMDDENKATSTLFNHLWKQADYAMAKSLCLVMKEETGYPQMNTLGNTMLECLKKRRCIVIFTWKCVSSFHYCMYRFTINVHTNIHSKNTS